MKTICADFSRPTSNIQKGAGYLTDVSGSRLSQRTRRYCSGEIICVEGEQIETVFQVIEGTAKAYKTTVDGKRQVLRFIKSEQWMADLACDEHRHSVEALGEVTLRLWRKRELQAHMRTDPLLASSMFEIAAQSLIRAEEHLLLERKSASERVAIFLLDLIGQSDNENAGAAPIIHISMQRADIADYLGLSTETVCRKITEITKCGVIDALTATKFQVNNIGALHRLAGRQHPRSRSIFQTRDN